MQCRCGRNVVVLPHCPSCGSSSVVGKQRNTLAMSMPDGERMVSRGFRCRRCAFDFHEYQACNAPALETAAVRASKVLVDKGVAALRARTLVTDEQKAKVAELMSQGKRMDAMKILFGDTKTSRRGEEDEE
jgi:hypothetical protein